MSNLINERAENWLRTLEGAGTKQYKQGKLRLRTKDGCYCVLGVAADLIATPDHKLPGKCPPITYSGAGVSLEWQLADLYGFIDEDISDPDVVEGLELLIELNDERDMTFPEIAAYVRANPKQFFARPK